VPQWIKSLFSEFIWRIPTQEKVIYLTFDDGPIPEVTDYVLETLAKYNAKASFFCVGENIAKNPSVFAKLVSDGHTVGNHTYNHVKGWQMTDEAYLGNIIKFEMQIQNFAKAQHIHLPAAKLFRPPYGRITTSQARKLKPKYKIVMWEVLTCDYDKTLSPEDCLKNAIKYTKPGSVVLFHDSLKAARNMKYALPKYLAYFSSLGFRFERLD